MVIQHGTPSDPSSTAVTTCNGKIDWVVKKQYGYKWSSDYTIATNGNNNLPVIAGQHTMDIGAGADHAVSLS